jgi:CHAD domain-containing protein
MPSATVLAIPKPATLASTAAKRILSQRFHDVARRLKPARDLPHHHDEHVHQLRVASRRADAALRAFADLLPGKRREATRDLLRTLRRAAGPARDWDVFRGHVVDAKPGEALKHFLLGIVYFHRHAEQNRVNRAVETGLAEWSKSARQLLASLDAGKATFESVIAARVEALEAKMVKALADTSPGSTIDELHRLRILGKRLRYTLELAPGPQEHPKMLGALRTLQDILGDWHDAHAAQVHLKQAKDAAACANGALNATISTGLTSLLKRFENLEAKQARLFRAWLKKWNQAFSKRGQEVVIEPRRK